MTDPYSIPLGDLAPLEQAGGKGRSLASLARAGFAVPEGRILLTNAYQRFTQEAGIDQSLLAAAKPEVVDGTLSFATAARRIHDLFEASPLPNALLGTMRNAYDELGGDRTPVAIRSSATAEDQPEHSFAGQQESFLNIRSFDALVRAVRDCWASAWSARALAYRHRVGNDNASVAVAVVVQRMVDADASGVVFTANPTTGTRAEMIINAGYGLGEGIVGGTVAPDEFVLDRATLTATDTRLGGKAQMILADRDGGTRAAPVDAEHHRRTSLSPNQLSELGRIAVEVESHYEGVPQDIEWAYASGKLWLLQSRPITNLPPEPPTGVRWDPPEPGAYLQRSQWVEHVPGPDSTLFETCT